MVTLHEGVQMGGHFGPDLRALVLCLRQQGSCHLGFRAAVNHERYGLV